MKRKIISILVSAIFLFLVLRKVDFQETWNVLQRIDLLYLLAAPFLFAGEVSLRNLRWHFILNRSDTIGYKSVNCIAFIGLMVNNLLPARIGELVRVWIVSRRSLISRSSALTSVILDRLFDGLTVVLILFAAVAFFKAPEWINNTAKIGGAFFIGGVLFFFFVVLYNKFFIRMLNRFLNNRDEKIIIFFHKKMNNLLKGLDVIKSFPMLLSATVISFLAWLGESFFYYGVTLSFGFDLSYTALLILTSIVALSIVLPSTPGYIGVHQFAVVQTLAVFGIAYNQAFGFALVVFVIQYLTVLFAGLFSISAIGISWKEITRKKFDEKEL